MLFDSTTPASEPVIYTLEHISTVGPDDWHAFTLAVTEVFWQLPTSLRPIKHAYTMRNMSQASDLFPQPSMLAFYGTAPWPVSLTVERERNRNVLSIQELDFQRQPCDFFARVVMLLLHNLCPRNFIIHSTAGGASWRLPKQWAEIHLNRLLSAPQPLPHYYDQVGGQIVSSLLLMLLDDPSRWISPTSWGFIAEIETRLYQPTSLTAG